MRCRTARQWITLALADEVPPRARRGLERHLEGCEGCRRERTAYAALDRGLGLLPAEAAVPAGLEREVMRQIQRESSAGVTASGGLGWWMGVPALAGAAALVLALRAAAPRTDAPPPGAVLARAPLATGSRAAPPAPPDRIAARRRRPAVPSEPPPDLTARPDLFVDLPILRNLERLEHFDAIQTTTLEGREEARSNG